MGKGGEEVGRRQRRVGKKRGGAKEAAVPRESIPDFTLSHAYAQVALLEFS